MGKYKREEPLEMFEIAGENYYFDLEELSSFIRIEHDETVEDILNEANWSCLYIIVMCKCSVHRSNQHFS